MDLNFEEDDEITKQVEKAIKVYDIILEIFLNHDKQPEYEIQPEVIQKRIRFVYDMLDHVNSLRLDANGPISKYRQIFATEILQFVFHKLSGLKNNLSYRKLLIESVAFLVMVPAFTKKTAKTTIKMKEIAFINKFPCFNELMYQKIEKDSLIEINESKEL